MPTPSNDPIPELAPIPSPPHRTLLHATCPPDDARPGHLSIATDAERPADDAERPADAANDAAATPHNATDLALNRDDAPHRPSNGRHSSSSSVASIASIDSNASTDSTQDLDAASELMLGPPSPISGQDDGKLDSLHGGLEVATFKHQNMPLLRPLPKYTPSFLRAGSKFTGTQHSDRQVYNVQVEIKHVDMAESLVCGYLRIEGLTADHPTLTTYFEGEIIGNKYTFQTRHDEWGSNEKVDMQHWNRFPAWRPLARAARRTDFTYKNYADREHIFMRWKEYFLVPDHRVRTISGASFEGFYYICFNQLSGTVSGIYFHAKSEKYQQLELTHVDDRGCLGAVEFR